MVGCTSRLRICHGDATEGTRANPGTRATESELLATSKSSAPNIAVGEVIFEQRVDSLVSALIVVDKFVPEEVCDTI